MRVAPQDFPRLFAQAEKQGNMVQHTTESEGKTSLVVDSEAKLKNLTAYRDSLRAMLAKPSFSVKDLVEIQEKLSEVQSELDSETATRKILANEIERIAVAINFRVERVSNRSSFTPIWDAFRESGSNLAESLATLITVIVSIIPWLIVIVPGFWRSQNIGARYDARRELLRRALRYSFARARSGLFRRDTTIPSCATIEWR
jgi:hypothetical protein